MANEKDIVSCPYCGSKFDSKEELSKHIDRYTMAQAFLKATRENGSSMTCLFFHSILLLKSIRRAGWVSKVQVEDVESVADHTFSMATMAMLLSDMLGFDTHKVIKMVLMHDLAESIVGDYMPGDVTARQKLVKEKRQ